jgi:chromosome segregation ATPase
MMCRRLCVCCVLVLDVCVRCVCPEHSRCFVSCAALVEAKDELAAAKANLDEAEKDKDDAKAELDEAEQHVERLGAIPSKTADDVAALAEAEAAVERQDVQQFSNDIRCSHGARH